MLNLRPRVPYLRRISHLRREYGPQVLARLLALRSSTWQARIHASCDPKTGNAITLANLLMIDWDRSTPTSAVESSVNLRLQLLITPDTSLARPKLHV